MTEITLKEAIADSRGWIDLKHLNSIRIEFRQRCLGSQTLEAEAIVINHGLCVGAGLPEDEIYSLYCKISKAAFSAKLMRKGTNILYLLPPNDDSEDSDECGYDHQYYHIMKIPCDNI